MVRTVFRGDSIRFGYDKHHPVLKDIAITIEDHSIYGLVGPAGSGKTTLAKVMLGLEKPDRGTLTWFNERINHSTNRRVGYVPHKKALFYDLTVYENVMLFGKLYRHRGARLKQQVEQALQLVGLWEERRQDALSLTDEQLQRLNIACGMVHRPDVIIFDEATSGIEVEAIPFIHAIVRQLHDLGMTIIYLSQNIAEIEQLCTHVGVLKDGCMIAEGRLDSLIAQYFKNPVAKLELEEYAEELTTQLSHYSILYSEANTLLLEAMDQQHDFQKIRSVLGKKLRRISPVEPRLANVYDRLVRRPRIDHHSL